jgi:hypothetical protein
MKNVHCKLNQLMLPHEVICMKLIEDILRPGPDINYLSLRDKLYDIFIYHLDVVECMWFIIQYLIVQGHLRAAVITPLMVKIVSFLQFYNNNYRPIYHLESMIMVLIQHVHAL